MVVLNCSLFLQRDRVIGNLTMKALVSPPLTKEPRY